MKIDDLILRHKNIALQFSGGKDSLTCLYLLKDYLDSITVYFVDSGDAFPETIKSVEHAKGLAKNFAVISGKQKESIAEFGIPSDIVPATHTQIGVITSGKGFVMQDRFSCCYRSIMAPMNERMLADEITLIIRGQKNSDSLKSPIRSGQVVDGIEYFFPLEDWTDKHVFTYLSDINAPIPKFYSQMEQQPDCMSCSAWWGEGRAAYLKDNHPDSYALYQQRLGLISEATESLIAAFNKEIEV